MSGEGFLEQGPGFATRAIHEGQDPEQWTSRSVVAPIFLSTTFKQDAPAQHRGFEYARCGNPTRNVLETCLASLDGAKHGLVFSSGLGATNVIANLLATGDHILAVDDLYGGSHRFFKEMADRLNVVTTFVDMTDEAGLDKHIRNNTKMVWMETPTNPLLRVMDIKKVADIVHAKNPDIIVVVDNTFLTSYFQRPLTLGADLVMYSLTKYMNGHSDVMMGAATTNNDSLHKKLRFLQNLLGTIPAPFDCYMVNRGLKTLAVRMRQHMTSGLQVARFLEKHPQVEKVFHPGLPSHPQHELSKRQCYGHSGMLSFYLRGGLTEVKAFFSQLRVFTLANSLGGTESLVALPTLMTHASVPLEERVKLGISDNLVRVSVGLEDVEDLIADLDYALNNSVNK